jgi:hypothetical protein
VRFGPVLSSSRFKRLEGLTFSTVSALHRESHEILTDSGDSPKMLNIQDDAGLPPGGI